MKPVPGLKFYVAVTASIKWTMALWSMFEFILLFILITLDLSEGMKFVFTFAALVIPVVAVLFLFTGYFAFTSRCKKIGFPVEGWTELPGEKEAMKSSTWWQMSLEIIPAKQETEIIRGCNDILKRMITSANKRFYKEQMGSTKRNKWIISDGPLIAHGSCSREILGDIIAMMFALQRSGHAIQAVKLQKTGKYYEVDAESDTMS